MKEMRTKRRNVNRLVRLWVERLEDRTCPTVFNDLANVLGPVTNIQMTLDNALNTASKIPLITQNGAGVLGTVTEAQFVTATAVNQAKAALNNAANNTDPLMITALEEAFSVNPGDVTLSNPGDGTVQIEVHFHHALETATLPLTLNLGLPGLPVQIKDLIKGTIDTQISYDFAFGFGYQGGNLVLKPDAKASDFNTNNVTFPAHQLALTAIVKLSDDFKVSANLGLLDATIDNRSHASGLTANFDVDNIGLTGAPVISPLTGNVNLNLHAAASFALSDATFQFPSIGTDLKINWDLANVNPDVTYDKVSFELGSFISGFVGPIIKDIQQITQPIQPMISVLTAPLPALSDLSHLIGEGDITILGIAKAAGSAGLFGAGLDELVQLVATLTEVTKDINAIDVGPNGVVVPLGSFSLNTSADSDSLKNGVALLPGIASGNLTNLTIQNGADIIQGIDDAVGNKIPGLDDAAKGALKKLGNLLDPAFQLNFPILDNPASVVFPMLLGHDADLASFDVNLDVDDAKLDAGYSMFGVGIDAKGDFGAHVHLHLGYDTKGLRDFFTDLTKQGGSAQPADLLHGFYLRDGTPGQPQFSLNGSFRIEAALNVGFYHVGIGGGVYTGGSLGSPDPINISFHDTDAVNDHGRLRLSAIDPNWLFDVDGTLKAGLGIEVKVGVDVPLVGFVGVEHTFTIAETTIFDLNGPPVNHKLGLGGIPSGNEPVIAGVDGAGNMTLFLGANVSQRQNVPDTTDGDPENWEVAHVSGDAINGETVTVKAFGVSQTLSGVKKIIAVGKVANQTITVDKDVAVGADLTGGDGADISAATEAGTTVTVTTAIPHGLDVGQKFSISGMTPAGYNGTFTVTEKVSDTQFRFVATAGLTPGVAFGRVGGDDVLTYQGTGIAKLIGGKGNDRLAVGTDAQASELHGGLGDDILIGGGGNDLLYGDENNDQLFGGKGAQTLDGGADDDQLNAGSGPDGLFGGSGDDVISWHSGNGVPTTVDGGIGTNILEVVGNASANVFNASAFGSAISLHADAVTFNASNIQNLSLDGQAGADIVTVNSLAGTTIREVHVNTSQTVAPDGANDVVNVDAGPSTSILIDEFVGVVSPAVPAQGSNPAKPEVKGGQALVNFLNQLSYKVYVANSEAGDSLTLSSLAGSTINVDLLLVDPVSYKSGDPVPASIPLAGQIIVNHHPGNIYNIRSTSGPTTISAQGSGNTFNIGSLAPNTGGTLAGITFALTVHGSGTDTLNIDDSGDTTGRIGTLTGTQVTGLGNAGAITYSGMIAVNLSLGKGDDHLTVSSTHAGRTSIDGGPGKDMIDLLALAGPTTVHGGADDDTITLRATSVVGPTNLYGDQGDDSLLVDQLPAGQVSDIVSLDGGLGADTDTVNISGAGNYLVSVSDSGLANQDTLIVNGTSQADNFLLRAASALAPSLVTDKRTPAAIVGGVAFVAALHGDPVSSVERINYTHGFNSLVVNEGAGNDSTTVDDNWAPTTINGNFGKDHFQVGQIFKSKRDAGAKVAPIDVFETIQTTRGFLSNGVSYPTIINGNEDNDDMTVFHNRATLNLNGNDGDDVFTVRSFAEEGSTDTNVNGGKNVNLIQYIANAKLKVDGGDGIDTLRIIGTEFADRYLITSDGVFGAGLDVSYTNIEKLEIDGAEGDDEFYVLSTGLVSNGTPIDVSLFGGLGNDLFSIAGDTADVKSGATTLGGAVQPHRVNLIQGPLHLDGAGGKGSAGGLGAPVMLPGETNLLTSDGPVLAYTGTGTSLSIDSMTVDTAALATAALRETGSSDVATLIGKTLQISIGPGIDRFWQITGVVNGGATTVLTLKSPGMPADEWGLPNATSEFKVTHLSPNFFVSETDTLDSVTVFNDGSTSNDVGALSATALTGLGMSATGITYANAESVEVLLGTGNDCFTVTGTATGAITAVHGGGGDDHIYVTGGGGASAPLLVYGDTTQDHSRYSSNGRCSTAGFYNADGVTPRPSNAFIFGNDGNDTIDASADTQTVAIYGGGGNDKIWGSQAGDQLAGGAGDDEIHGQDGADHIYGDSGFNQNLTSRLDRVTPASGLQILTVATTETAGNDKLFGDGGDDILLGDHGIITQAPGTQRLFTTGFVTQVETNNVANGGNDEIHGGLGNDLLLGGAGNDVASGDDGSDILMGDHGLITYATFIGNLSRPDLIQSTSLTIGGADTLYGNAGADLLVGGAAGDFIDGGSGDDLILGDAVQLANRFTDITNPRFEALSGAQIYDNTTGQALVDGVARNYRNLDGSAPAWASFQIQNLYHSATIQAANDNSFGNDYIAGGAGNDTIFGQLGDDTIQGDGSIDSAVGANPQPVGNSQLTFTPSFEASTDGNDYIEGGGGSDTIFGGLGQDDIIGGSSNMFTLTTPSLRPDGNDILFGGAGTRIARNDLGDTSTTGHASDADYLVGDNGNIFRLAETNGTGGGGFLVFNYDSYGPAKIIPRAVQPLDYTPGVAAGTDIGGNDTIHGEAGDDFIHGETGNDILFGEGQDDQLIGGAGNDRIYGGAGEDSILGDDGRFILSRNGLTEPLYGVTTVNAQIDITLPGPFTGAWVYITGRLNSQARLIVPTLGGNDVIYGGLGDDFLHAGTGDDAISGAEAQAAWYNDLAVGATFYTHGGFAVADPSNPLGYSATTRKLAAYDANNPLARIPSFFLNFDAYTDANSQAASKIDDGKDCVFGDDGNDWLVGGTGNNRLFGGKGDDLMNADNNLDTNAGLNNQPDATAFADRDFVYGGDGLDVMIANTGGDRLYDWAGEFNTYLVPFGAFGEPTVSRIPSPQIQAFLLSLGQTSGADQSMTEPNGELGLFTHSDPQWAANHGSPRDPQPGNVGGSARDTQGGPEDDRGTSLPLNATPAMVPAGSVATNATDATVGAVYVATDPSNAAARALFVGGTNGNDNILVRQGSSTAYVDVVVNGVDQGQFAITSNGLTMNRVIIYGNAGDDSVIVNQNVNVDTVIYGGAGNDALTGGGGGNFIDGGTGNDVINGGANRNILIGGLGQDILNGGKDEDLLLGGSWKYSEDLSAVDGALTTWKSSASFNQRVSEMRIGGTDGMFAFSGAVILDDAAIDQVFGNQDQDWFWIFANDQTDTRGNDIAN